MPDESSPLQSILKDCVPKELYDELRNRYDELLLKMGRIQEQMLFLLDYRLGEEKESHEEHHLKEEIIDHIRNTLDFQSYKEKQGDPDRTSGKLLVELRKKYDEIERLKRYIENIKADR
jgi:hypothetical protein